MAQLSMAEGPACKGCGCRDSKVVSRTVRWGREIARRVCTACGQEWSSAERPANAPTLNGVTFVRVRCRCPKCKAANPPITSNRGGGVRYHQCDQCGTSFKSVEG